MDSSLVQLLDEDLLDISVCHDDFTIECNAQTTNSDFNCTKISDHINNPTDINNFNNKLEISNPTVINNCNNILNSEKNENVVANYIAPHNEEIIIPNKNPSKIKLTKYGIKTNSNKIAQRLGEKNFALIRGIVNSIGNQNALKLLNDTIVADSEGGMVTDTGVKRSMGGIYIQLIGSRDYIDEDKKIKAKEFIRDIGRVTKKRRKLFKKRSNHKDLREELNDKKHIAKLNTELSEMTVD